MDKSYTSILRTILNQPMKTCISRNFVIYSMLYFIYMCANATLCDYFSIKTIYVICINTLYRHFLLYTTLVKYTLTDKK